MPKEKPARVIKRNDQYCVIGVAGNTYGTYASRTGAEKRLRQLNKFAVDGSPSLAIQLHKEAELYIQAADSESYSPTYEQDPETLKVLERLDKRYQTAMRKYLKELSERVLGYVNWGEVQFRKAADVINPLDSPEWTQESLFFEQTVHDIIYLGQLNGMRAGVNIYSMPLQEADLVKIVQKLAKTHTAELVKRVNSTTRDMIRNSIATSIELGENTAQARDRLSTIINNPNRAKVIAHTESVNAYGAGMQAFAEESGADGKYWQAVVDKRTSRICRELDSKYGSPEQAIKINKEFVHFAGSTMRQPAHVNCRAGIVLTYP